MEKRYNKEMARYKNIKDVKPTPEQLEQLRKDKEILNNLFT